MDDMSVEHVYPLNDVVGHNIEGGDCICGPEVRFVEGGTLVIHHSLDGREATALGPEDYLAHEAAIQIEIAASVLEHERAEHEFDTIVPLREAHESITDLLTAARHLLDCSQASEPFEVEALRALEGAVSRLEGTP